MSLPALQLSVDDFLKVEKLLTRLRNAYELANPKDWDQGLREEYTELSWTVKPLQHIVDSLSKVLYASRPTNSADHDEHVERLERAARRCYQSIIAFLEMIPRFMTPG